MRKKIFIIIKILLGMLFLFIVVRAVSTTWTPSIQGEKSVSELREVDINGVSLDVMIRGNDKDNPVLIFVHGGPCCSEIPYVRKYQQDLEKEFTIVHYDQRGSGKSYEFGVDYSEVTASTHVEDLISLTEYIKEYLQKEQVILLGHSYGTYIATMAVGERPDLYQAYIGIGQMSNTIESELMSLEECIKAAETDGNEKDVEYLENLESVIAAGEDITPRDYVRKYGFAARKIDDNADYINAFLFGTEYNLVDAVRFYTASIKYQDALIEEALEQPITDIVTEINVPVYFVMGKYDGMTSSKAAEKYLNSIAGDGTKEIILFDESAHYPQFEEKEKFYQWMKDTFKE